MTSASTKSTNGTSLSDLPTWYPCFWRHTDEPASDQDPNQVDDGSKRGRSEAWRLRRELIYIRLRREYLDEEKVARRLLADTAPSVRRLPLGPGHGSTPSGGRRK